MSIIEEISEPLFNWIIENRSRLNTIPPQTTLKHILDIVERAEVVKENDFIDDVSKSFEIGEEVLHKTVSVVEISAYCEDVERVEVCSGCDYYTVDINQLVKI
tara:strand:+ start:6691 stop:6999 length:309 start_codon:yes stop_codon:yes gene_type:complete